MSDPETDLSVAFLKARYDDHLGDIFWENLEECQVEIAGWMSADMNWVDRKGPPPVRKGEIDPVIWSYSTLPEDPIEALRWYRKTAGAMYYDMSAKTYVEIVSHLWIRAGYEVFGKRLLEEAQHLGE